MSIIDSSALRAACGSAKLFGGPSHFGTPPLDLEEVRLSEALVTDVLALAPKSVELMGVF